MAKYALSHGSSERVLGATDEAFGLTPRDGDIAERLAPEPDELGCADCG